MVSEALQVRRDEARKILEDNTRLFQIAREIGIQSIQGLCTNLISLNIGRFWNNFDKEADDRGGNSASNFELAAHILRKLRQYATPEIINALVVELGRAQDEMQRLQNIDYVSSNEQILEEAEKDTQRQTEEAFIRHSRRQGVKDRRNQVTATERYIASHIEIPTASLSIEKVGIVRRVKGTLTNPFLMQGAERFHSIELKITIEWQNGEKGAFGQQFLIYPFSGSNQELDVNFVVPANVPKNFGLDIVARNQQTGERIQSKVAMNREIE